MHWYVLSTVTGMVTLCASEIDARREAQAYDRLYPGAAPHVATRLVPVEYADEIERLTAEAEAQKKAANHWFTEANKEHNRAERLRGEVEQLRAQLAEYEDDHRAITAMEVTLFGVKCHLPACIAGSVVRACEREV